MNFFAEFILLFFPDLHKQMDFEQMRFMQQELFTDVTVGAKRKVDLLVETRLYEEPGLILIHTETQAQYKPDFMERMFVYFSRLYEKYRCKIIPIVLFSHGHSHVEPDQFEMKFSFMEVLQFPGLVVQLKKRNWREFVESDNPLAAAKAMEIMSNWERKALEKGRLEGRVEGIRQGIEKGERQAKLELARKLRADGPDERGYFALSGCTPSKTSFRTRTAERLLGSFFVYIEK